MPPNIATHARYLGILLAIALLISVLFIWHNDLIQMEGILALGAQHM